MHNTQSHEPYNTSAAAQQPIRSTAPSSAQTAFPNHITRFTAFLIQRDAKQEVVKKAGRRRP